MENPYLRASTNWLVGSAFGYHPSAYGSDVDSLSISFLGNCIAMHWGYLEFLLFGLAVTGVTQAVLMSVLLMAFSLSHFAFIDSSLFLQSHEDCTIIVLTCLHDLGKSHHSCPPPTL